MESSASHECQLSQVCLRGASEGVMYDSSSGAGGMPSAKSDEELFSEERLLGRSEIDGVRMDEGPVLRKTSPGNSGDGSRMKVGMMLAEWVVGMSAGDQLLPEML